MEPLNISYWNLTSEKINFPKLEDNLEIDTLIIGSGITGITCACALASKGEKPVVIEAGELCDGTTGNTTGKITIQYDIIYTNLVKKYGVKFAKDYAKSQTSAIEFVKEIVDKENIDCNLVDTTTYLYASNKTDKSIIQKEYEVTKSLGIDCVYINDKDFPPKNLCMLGFKNQLLFHSVRYLKGLAKAAVSKGAKIYCSTKAINVKDGEKIEVTCENGVKIIAKNLVIATSYPIYDGPNVFFTRLYAKRSYGIAVEPKSQIPDGSYINITSPTRSIRTHIENGKTILIVVGEGHATGREEEKMKDHYNNLIQFAEEIAGVKKVLAKWSAQDYETPDQVPYIGKIAKNSNIYVGTGYKKWGLSTGTLAGNMIADLITNKENKYEEIYSRSRLDYSSSIRKVVNGVMTPIGQLIKSKFENVDDIRNLKKGEGKVIIYKGKKAGIYRDSDDNITIINVACDHMSTILNFNPLEKTWDCPAHGGRYAADGKLLEGVPKNSLKILYTGKYQDIAND